MGGEGAGKGAWIRHGTPGVEAQGGRGPRVLDIRVVGNKEVRLREKLEHEWRE
jgi:hypothetical protein